MTNSGLTIIVPKFLKPKPIKGLERMGSDMDGGYILPKSILKKTSAMLSLGIGDNWEMDTDYHALTKNPVHGYDYSFYHSSFLNNWAYLLVRIVARLIPIQGRRFRPVEALKLLLTGRRANTPQGLHDFFDGTKNIFYDYAIAGKDTHARFHLWNIQPIKIMGLYQITKLNIV